MALGIFGAQLENVADFNAPGRLQSLGRIVDGAISGLGLAHIHHLCRAGGILCPSWPPPRGSQTRWSRYKVFQVYHRLVN
jgi:integral membrane sensor domain MASE1